MARRSELVALDLHDVNCHPNGSATVLIQRSKTDQAGEGAVAYLFRSTVLYLSVWLEKAGIALPAYEMPDERVLCPIFRRVRSNGLIGERLHADIVSDIDRRVAAVAAYIGMPAKKVAQVSGHSIWLGATQDLLALNIDLASVMQPGRWKSTAMPMRYGEEVLAARGGMARAAQVQGREITNQVNDS